MNPYFTTQNNFLASFPDTNLVQGGVKKNAVQNRGNFITTQDKTHRDETSRPFAALLKEHEDRQNKGINHTKDDQRFSNHLKSAGSGADNDQFTTKQTMVKAQPPFPSSDTGFTEGVIESYGQDLAIFSARIRALIEAGGQKHDEKTGQIVTVQDPDTEATKNSIKTLARLLGLINPQEDQQTQTLSDDESFALVLREIDKIIENDSALSGLTVEQLTDLQDQITRYLEGVLDQREIDALHSLAANYSALAAPVAERAPVRAKNVTNTPNNVVKDTPTTQADIKSQSATRYDARYDYDIGRDSAGGNTDDAGFDKALRDSKMKATQAEYTPPTQATSTGAGERFLSNSGLLLPSGVITEQTGLLTASPLATTTSALTQGASAFSSSLTSPLIQASHAGHAHPATQAISLTIHKAIKGGEDTQIKLQLDPPELGRVEVKMSIDKDNITKLVLTVEKPETFLMLQRDADALHRAMADAGLDMQDGSLEFELSQDGQDKSQHGRNTNGNNGAKGVDANDGDIIETQMNWQIDPQTGRTRYDILV